MAGTCKECTCSFLPVVSHYDNIATAVQIAKINSAHYSICFIHTLLVLYITVANNVSNDSNYHQLTKLIEISIFTDCADFTRQCCRPGRGKAIKAI